MKTETINYVTNLPMGYKQLTVPGITLQHLVDEDTGHICKAVSYMDWCKIRDEIEAYYPGFLNKHGYTL